MNSSSKFTCSLIYRMLLLFWIMPKIKKLRISNRLWDAHARGIGGFFVQNCLGITCLKAPWSKFKIAKMLKKMHFSPKSTRARALLLGFFHNWILWSQYTILSSRAKKSAFYDNFKLFLNTIKIFRRKLLFVCSQHSRHLILWNPQTFFAFCFTMFTKRKCSQLK